MEHIHGTPDLWESEHLVMSRLGAIPLCDLCVMACDSACMMRAMYIQKLHELWSCVRVLNPGKIKEYVGTCSINMLSFFFKYHSTCTSILYLHPINEPNLADLIVSVN